jgi:chemotaxis protein MotB
MSHDDTGIVVSPPRTSPSGGRRGSPEGARRRRQLVFTAVWMLLANGVGAGAVYLAMQQRLGAANAQLGDARARAASAAQAITGAQTRATAIAAELEVAKAKVQQSEAELASERAAAVKLIADKASEAKALEDKLTSVLAGQGEVTAADGSIRVELVDKVLFGVGQAALSERGKLVLSRVGAALLEARDKQIWVQGHTDDLPITPDKGVMPTFSTNWELSAARALTVVHYLQDVSKIEPQRLAAVAFGQYRPVSRTRAKNRRIEIVLYPKLAVKPR